MSQSIETNENVSVPHEKGVHVVRAITIDRPVEELYAFWKDFTHMPDIFSYVESVEIIDHQRSHWTLKLPGDETTEFDAEIYTDVPNEVISWRSLPGSDLQNAGSVRFRPAPADRGVEVRLTVEFVPAGGAIGRAIFNLFGEAPAQYIGQFLREFKQLMETGEKATIEGQPSGREEEAEA